MENDRELCTLPCFLQVIGTSLFLTDHTVRVRLLDGLTENVSSTSWCPLPIRCDNKTSGPCWQQFSVPEGIYILLTVWHFSLLPSCVVLLLATD